MATALNCFSLLKQRSTVLRRPPGQRLTAQPGPALSTIARAGKYAPLVPALRELILRPDTPLEADVKDMIAGQLDTAQARPTLGTEASASAPPVFERLTGGRHDGGQHGQHELAAISASGCQAPHSTARYPAAA